MFNSNRDPDFIPHIKDSTVLQDFISLVETKTGYLVKPIGNGYSARCPAHNDHDPSLSISEGNDGRVLVTCHAGCTFDAICASLGLEPRKLFPQEAESYSPTFFEERKPTTTYPYKNKEGKIICWKERYEPGFSGKDKSFVWKRFGDNGEIIKDRKGCEETLYHLPEIITGIEKGVSVFVVEGEKDADTLLKHGAIATTASNSKEWNNEFTNTLKDADVVVLYDNDKAGLIRKELITRELAGKVKKLRVVDLPGFVYRESHGQDITDWFSIDGNTIEKFMQIVEKTPEYQIPATQQKGGLRPLSLKQLFSLHLPPRIMLLHPFLPSQGLVMIVAKRGVGKTYVALGIAYAVASGGKFLGWSAPKPKRVLYIDGEMPMVSIRERLRIVEDISSTKADPEFLQLLTPDYQEHNMPDLSTQAGRDEIELLVDDIDLIIIDNISTLFRSGCENEAESWQEAQEWALRLRKKGKSVIFVHHAGKGGVQRGTSKREDILDAVIMLKNPEGYKQEEGARFEVIFDKARHFSGEEARSFQAHLRKDDDTYYWEMSGISEDEKIAQIATMKKRGLTIEQIRQEAGLSKSQVETLLKKAKEKGLL